MYCTCMYSHLQVAKHRDTALFLTALPASVTTQKMEGLLETEADCNVEEVCLLKVQFNTEIHVMNHNYISGHIGCRTS